MRRRARIRGGWAAAAALGLALVASANGQREVDAVAAVVNGQAITVSQVEAAAWYVRLSERLGKARLERPAPPTASERRAALEHLIDQALIAQASGAEVADDGSAQWGHLVAEAGGERALERWCAAYHLTPEAVRRIMARQVALLAAADRKLEPEVRIAPAAVGQYYRQEYVPAARRRGLRPESLARARAAIRALLAERQMLALEDQWLARLHASGAIRVLRP